MTPEERATINRQFNNSEADIERYSGGIDLAMNSQEMNDDTAQEINRMFGNTSEDIAKYG